MTKQYFDFQKPNSDFQECERICMTRFRLEEVKKKNFRLQKNLEIFKQDMNFLLKKLSLVFALNLYIDRIGEFELVEGVYFVEKEELIDVWTLIKENNLDVEEKIAEAQCELMRIHKELDFDFMVFPLFGEDVKNILPVHSIQVYPKKELR